VADPKARWHVTSLEKHDGNTRGLLVMLDLKIIKLLLVAVFAGPVLSVVATCIVSLLLLLLLLPGGLEILLLEWERATGWVGKLLLRGRLRRALAWTANL
jgi:hypothetical protein